MAAVAAALAPMRADCFGYALGLSLLVIFAGGAGMLRGAVLLEASLVNAEIIPIGGKGVLTAAALTDNANCGACGTSCNTGIGQSCKAAVAGTTLTVGVLFGLCVAVFGGAFTRERLQYLFEQALVARRPTARWS